jgi:hypothetical protein
MSSFCRATGHRFYNTSDLHKSSKLQDKAEFDFPLTTKTIFPYEIRGVDVFQDTGE